MTEKDFLKQLKQLKKIKPNKDWALSARRDLINHINVDSPKNLQANKLSPVVSWYQSRFVGALVLAVIVMGMGSIAFAEKSPSAPFKILSKNLETLVAPDVQKETTLLYVALVEQRVDRVSERANEILQDEEGEDKDAQNQNIIAQAVKEYKEELEQARESGDEDAIAEVREKAEILTNILPTEKISEEEFVDNLRKDAEAKLLVCQDQTLLEEIRESLDQENDRGLVRAIEVLGRCLALE